MCHKLLHVFCHIPFKPGMSPLAACTWFFEITLVCMSVCVSVCLAPRTLITSGVIWYDIGRVQLVKQVSWLFPAFNYFI